jgi:hypothetical protein
MATTCVWTGASGRRYEYNVYNIDSAWNDVPGNYIFTCRATNGWRNCYTGQTESFRDRFPDHEKRACAARHGATHIHAHVNAGGENTRKLEESDIIAKCTPPCNVRK